MTDKDAAELVRLMAIYVVFRPALQQMLGDLERSKPANADKSLRDLFRQLRLVAGKTPDAAYGADCPAGHGKQCCGFPDACREALKRGEETQRDQPGGDHR